MYNQFQNYYQQVPQSPRAILRGRPVSSLDEVRATSIDFDGSVFYFPDLANKRIYTKQINVDGTALLNMYELRSMPLEPTTPMLSGNYVTKEEFDETLKKIQEMFNSLSQQQQPEIAPEYKF